MSAPPRSWVCIDCRMTATFDPPQASPPAAWVEGPRGWLCLNCQREEVAAAVPVTRDAEGREARRRALTEFELLRDPEASDGQIARRAHTSPAVVRPVRADLRADGRLAAEDPDD